MMGKREIETTYAENMMLDFLRKNEGRRFTEREIEAQTRLRFTLVRDVAESLKAKGYPVQEARGKYIYRENKFINWVLTVFLCLIIVNIFFFAFLQYLEEEPETYNYYESE